MNFSPTRLAPVSRDDHAAFAPSRSCSPVRSIFQSCQTLQTVQPCATSDLQIELLRFSLREYCFLHDFFSNFAHISFSSCGTCSEISGGAGAKTNGKGPTPSTQTTANTEKEGAPHPSAHSLISCKMWRRGARSVGMAGGMGRSLPARSALLQSNTATTLTSTSVPPLDPSNRHSCTLIFLSIYL